MVTSRQALKELLQEGTFSTLELSQRLSLSEKEVLTHLAHIARSPGPGAAIGRGGSGSNSHIHCGFDFSQPLAATAARTLAVLV